MSLQYSISNPYTGELIGDYRYANSEKISEIIAILKTGQLTQKKTAAHERADILRKLAGLLEENAEELAQLITSETGKTISDSRVEMTRAINATLAICNIILRKQDKAGMLTFSKKLEDLIVAEQRNSQMNLISESLYNVQTDFYESDYSLLYATIKRKITHRSLLILFTNFETMDSLKRQLPYLRGIAKNHLLLVVFFKNTELDKIINKKSETVLDVYDKIIAEKFMLEKKKIVNELKKYGIQSVLTKPEELTSETINKYLEFKSRGLF